MAGPTSALEPTSVLHSRTPTFSFQPPEQWHRLPVIQLQLTSRNLRDLGAALKTLNVSGQTPRASPSPSDSSSDSESNHRIHRSTKKVCVREDMNTIREISPRPSKPIAIVVPDPLATSKAKWTKPDTPAPWRTPAQSVKDEADDDGTPRAAHDNSRSLPEPSIQSEQLSTSPLNTLVTRKRSSSKVDASERIVASTSRPHIRAEPCESAFFRNRCGNGIGIRRRSNFALPRPQSLAARWTLRLPSGPRSPSMPSELGILPPGHLKADDSPSCTSGARFAQESSYPPTDELSLRYSVDGPVTATLDALADDLNYYPIPAQPIPAAYSSLPDRLQQPRTYVDHVRAQRQPPQTAAHGKVPTPDEGREIRITRQRSASL